VCEGDLDGNGSVNVKDLLILILAWGSNDPSVDLDGDGVIAVSDLLILLDSWGACL